MTVDELFEQFVTEYGTGRDPDVRDYLERAGSERSELGAMIDSYLSFAPIGDTDEETVILVNARIARRTPFQEARARRKLAFGAVVEQLREQLKLSTNLTHRLGDAYEDLERDWLDPRGVKPPVWAALSRILGVDVRRLVSTEEQSTLGVALMRRDATKATAAPGPSSERQPRDEIDELFRGTSPSN